ncbi:MAG: hypothetical protein M3N51_07795 [Actinomycetota bacterium]|nr:hypothetical protein [Actinomycetota bacterium]
MDYREVEEALCRLPTVDAARLVGDQQTVSEVHILAATGKPPKQVVRDIQSLAMARFGLNIDRRVVSVVQMAGQGMGEVERPVIVGVREAPDGSRTTVTVTLSWRGQSFAGESTGPSAAATRLRLIGEAAVRALEQALGGGPALALEAVAVPTVGSRQVAVAQVVTVVNGGEETMVGSALVRNDPAEALARAVLDAVNRRAPHLSR